MSYRPDNVYHVTVMPCYDKKLEAVRDDFSFPMEELQDGHAKSGARIAEVDSVLTSGEVLDLIQVGVLHSLCIRIYCFNRIRHCAFF